MYNGIQKIDEIIDYIEQDLLTGPDCSTLASKMHLSVYEFRRIFAFVVGCPLSEYIRKRRLSLAACELSKRRHTDIGSLAEKYGYSNQSAFTKAFREQHGVSPSAFLKEGCPLKLFTRPQFSVSIQGREAVPLRLLHTEAFCIRGYQAISGLTDTCCCENVWNGFYETGADKLLCGDRIYAAYENRGSDVACTIGEAAQDTATLPGLQLPAAHWVCCSLNTTEDGAVNEVYSRLLWQWLPSAKLKRNEALPILEVYPADMTAEGFTWEIRVPIE